MNRRIIAGIGLGDGVDDRLRLLRCRGAVEIVPADDGRELVADVERGVDAGGSVHTTLLRASRAATQIRSPSFALSHSPMTKPSSSNARADAGSSPRLWA